MQTLRLSLRTSREKIEEGAGFPLIAVIKALRTVTGLGLRDSKVAVEQLRDSGKVEITIESTERLNTSPFEEFTFILAEADSLRMEVSKTLTDFAKRAVDEKDYNLARTLIDTLERL